MIQLVKFQHNLLTGNKKTCFFSLFKSTKYEIIPVIISYNIYKINKGPRWFNELGSWIT